MNNINSDKIFDFYNNYDKVSKIDNYTIKYSKNNSLFLNIEKEKVYKLARSIANIKTYAKDEFNNYDNSVFNIIKIEKKEKIKIFLLHMLFYSIDAVHTKIKPVIGLDFEFDQRKISLCQISLYPNRKHKYVYVIDPNMFERTELDLLVQTVFISNCYKIVHGADSLDIPYMFDDLFQKDKTTIIKFIKNVIDSRFLCEYYKIYAESDNKKCSIYDALLYFNTINSKKYDDLNLINDTMGPVQDVNWNIVKMSSYNLKYAAYDVLFLKHFVLDIFKKSDTLEYLFDNIKMIPYITRFIFLEKHGIINNVVESKTITDPVNNYIAKLPSGNKTLISIYNELIEKITIPSLNLKVKTIMEINYFKTPLSLIFKRIIYSTVSDLYPIYENKNDKYNNHIYFREMYQSLNQVQLGKIIYLLEKFYVEVKLELI